MSVPVLAPHFCQVAWVVEDIAKAETFFTQIMGVTKFVRADSWAKDNEGTYMGHPGIGSFQEGHEFRRNLKAGNF